MAQWFYTKNGQQVGPVDEAELRNLLSSGQVASSELVWKDGMANWVAASTVPELADTTGGEIPLAPAPPPSRQPVQALPYGGYPSPTPQYASGSVPNYLTQSILVTICCCWPLGIPAIVFAAQVNGKLAVGDYAGAVEASNKAKMFCWISFGLGLLVIVGYALVGVISAMSHH
jgi:hypothetical protein